jgi:hypothetical protein
VASGWTNKGKFRTLGVVFRAATPPTNFYLALCADAVTPTVDTNVLGDLSENPNGNGYTTGGYQLNRNSTDFDTLTEDDTGDKGILKIKDVIFTASGGNLPASGNGARWAVLTDDNGTVGSREVWAWWDLAANRVVSTGQTLSLIDCELDLT